MLLTIKDLAEQLRIKPATLYSWAAQGKIPCRKIHGLVRFDQHDIDRWLSSFPPPTSSPLQIGKRMADHSDLERLIASVKREVYTSGHGETRPRSSLIGKEEHDGALEAE
ncbi:MAG: helix-turn-helix domain-containing protein [Nitrospirae bacterium]|nr:helix-turn-helix domain-containing protein [Nitrospirota bacterium]MBU6479062.1 helix-turn-helix domain-containing protein [Nitrospirota bacterium]MDE3050135.1 helix-turn-helix domain-containing protein [Nitrospirota bacterium]